MDLRVDDDGDPVEQLDRLVRRSGRYHRTVEAFDLVLGGHTDAALERLEELPPFDPAEDHDVALWTAVVLGLGGREDEAERLLAVLAEVAPAFIAIARGFSDVGVVPEPERLRALVDAAADV